MGINGGFNWAMPGVIDALKVHWGKGLSASRVALELNRSFHPDPPLSRNAIIGKVTRLRLDSHPRCGSPRHREDGGRNASTVKRVRRIKIQSGVEIPVEPLPPPPIDDLAIPQAQRRTIMELSGDTCRWPVGDPAAADFFFCGAPPRDGRPYCPAHSARAFNKPQPPKHRHMANGNGRFG